MSPSRSPNHPHSPLSEGWRTWIAENKMQGLDDQKLVQILIQQGFEENVALEELSRIATDSCFRAGTCMAQKAKKLESLLETYARLADASNASRFRTIERRNNVPREEFLERYYAANRPVVLLNLMQNWKANSLWTPEYLRNNFGDEVVEVMTQRDSDKRYEINSVSHKQHITFRNYIDCITDVIESNDCYIVANNDLLGRESFKRLRDDFNCFSEYLNATQIDGCVFFWFGPAGTVTPLHHDVLNIFLAQVRGRKKVTLIPSWHTPNVYNKIGVYSEVDCEQPDYAQFPRFREARTLTLILRPGEVLFIPVGWWHHVRALDLSISVSFSNFVFPNTYRWEHPDLVP